METSVQYAMLHCSSQSATSLLLLKSSLLVGAPLFLCASCAPSQISCTNCARRMLKQNTMLCHFVKVSEAWNMLHPSFAVVFKCKYPPHTADRSDA
jgi:hypothetical protein